MLQNMFNIILQMDLFFYYIYRMSVYFKKNGSNYKIMLYS